MKAIISKIKRFFRKVTGFIPAPLPVGFTEFQEWADSMADTYDLPTKDQDSVRYALATMILHLGPTVAYKPAWYFVLSIHSACAKQVAGATFQDIKLRQAAAQAAETKAATEKLVPLVDTQQQ